VPGAADVLARTRAEGRRILLFTNGTGKPPAEYAADLRRVGFDVADEEFMNPAVVAARYIARMHPGASVLVLGCPGVVAPLHALGVRTVDAGGEVVLVGWDDALTYAQLHAACDAVWSGAPLLATSTAPVFSVAGRAAPGWSGAVVAAIQQVTGAPALTLGKPSSVALEEMCRALDAPPARTLVVGDDLDLEIMMACDGGARAALVLTGISSDDDVAARPPARRPAATLADVTHLWAD
jgi:NagD protein